MNNFNYNYFGGQGNMSVVDKVPQDMLYLVDSHWLQFAVRK
jgi:hypothetical protein